MIEKTKTCNVCKAPRPLSEYVGDGKVCKACRESYKPAKRKRKNPASHPWNR